MPSSRVLATLGALVLAHVVLAWLMRVPDIGWGEDDAVYSLLARALASGTYREFWIVDAPIHARYPPGFPALLATSNALFGERLDAQLALIAGCSATGLLLLFDASRRRLGSDVALWATGLMALNPIVISEAGRIMTEAPFRLLLLLTLWAVTVRHDGQGATVAGAAAVLASLVRTAGVAALAALALHWALKRQWTRVAGLGLASVPAIAWLAWTAIAPNPGETGVYVHVVSGGEQPVHVSLLERTAVTAWIYVRESVPVSLAFFALKRNPLDNFLWAGLAAVSIPVGLAALWRQWRPALLLLATYAAVLLAWPWRDPRFVSPVSGLLFVVIATGAAVVARALHVRRVHLVLVPVAALFLAGAWQAGWPPLRDRVACDRSRPAESPICSSEDRRGMQQLAEFVRVNTPPDAIFFAPKEGAFHYHTGRRVIRDRRAVRTPPDSFTTHLRRSGVAFAVLTPIGINWIGHNRQLGNSCGEFELVRTFIGDAALLRLMSGPSATAEDGAACEIALPWKDGPPAKWRENLLR